MDPRHLRRCPPRPHPEGAALTTATPIREQLAARADAARRRARTAKPELGLNHLTPDQVLGLDEAKLAELVAVDHFGWPLVNPDSGVYEAPPGDPKVAYATRCFTPCSNANDDWLALKFVKKRHPHLLGLLATALLDLARGRAAPTGAPVDPLMVAVYAPRGDFCRALLLMASTVWRQQRAAQRASQRLSQPTPLPTPQPASQPSGEREVHQHPEHKETSHEEQLDTPGRQPAAPARVEAAVSHGGRAPKRAGTGAATPAPRAGSPTQSGETDGPPT